VVQAKEREPVICATALAGHGLAWLPLDAVHEHLVERRLISVLEDLATSFADYCACYATRRASPAAILLVEALRSSTDARRV
jgi:DNA-binding transcriptional LysR family regulator